MTSWHPLLALHEPSPGTWDMVDASGRTYAAIVLVRRGGELGYRADLLEGDARRLVGYFVTLRAACEQSHAAFVRSHAPGQHPKGLGG